jgi:hypothetical protein
MNKTYEKEERFPPEYKKARHVTPQIVSRTDSVPSTSRSIATSCTEGTIKVILINKPQPSKDVDKSTS